MPDSAFAFQPSIGTWLQYRLSWRPQPDVVEYPCCVNVNEDVAALCAPFAKKPSVGTWLLWQVDAAADTDCVCADCVDQGGSIAAIVAKNDLVELVATIAVPWEADFEAEFVGACNIVTSTRATTVSSAPWTDVASLQPVATSSSVSFSLAPPPKPSGTLSVGTSPLAANVVVIDDLTHAGKIIGPEISALYKQALEREEIICTGPTYHDDEETLLNTNRVLLDDPFVQAVSRSRVQDDVDSASESEDENDGTQAMFPRTHHGLAARAVLGNTRPTCRPMSTDMVTESFPEDRAAAAANGPSKLSASNRTADDLATSGLVQVPKQVDDDAKFKVHASSEAPMYKSSSHELGSMKEVGVPRQASSVRNSAAQFVQPSAQGVRLFQVQVAHPHPGVQYRKSKRLADRDDSFAATGATVVGYVEDDGEWLRINDRQYLPIRLNGVQLLQPLPQPMDRRSNIKQNDPSSPDLWWIWTWCSACEGDHTSHNIDITFGHLEDPSTVSSADCNQDVVTSH
eukprot:TRINITY_DN3501_c1_g1_i1.p1 TRINITY_DN3501_c1_g1~~TRINITY_DN3501_c1_g1_i1.p1  ORF type:complete len:513 (+),score=70.72 TRINITY_DN3501_c1_g1_i1:137-1675(+)